MMCRYITGLLRRATCGDSNLRHSMRVMRLLHHTSYIRPPLQKKISLTTLRHHLQGMPPTRAWLHFDPAPKISKILALYKTFKSLI
jgi:hypothetical protein